MISTYSSQLAKLDFYPQWSSLPSFQSDIDPFDYSGRMGVFKLLIDALNINGAFGEDNQLNVFWGYVFQLSWQWRSGRLTFSNTLPNRIDPHSMWGYANHSLSVIPLIAAINVGLLKPLVIHKPSEQSAIEYAHGGGKSAYIIPEDYAEALPEWVEFFQLARNLKPGDDVEPLRFKLWKAHHKSLLGAERVIDRVGTRYHAKAELAFLIGWIRMVDFLGSAAWRTDLDYMLENGIGVLPERIMKGDDKPGHIRDMSPEVNSNIVNIIGLTKQSKLRFAFNLFLWKRAMRSRQARAEVLPMLDATFNPSPKNRPERMRLFRYMIAL